MSDTTDQAVNTQVEEQPTTATESAPVENKETEVAESDQAIADKAVADSLSKVGTEDQSQEPEVVETKAEEQPQGAAEDRKQALEGDIETYKERLGISPNSEIRDLVAARNALKQVVESATAQVYEPSTEDDLVNQGYSETDAKLQAMQERLDLKEFNEGVTEAQFSIDSESSRVLNDFPMFDPKPDEQGKPTNPEYKPQIASQAAALLEQNLIRHPSIPEIDPSTGQPTGKGIVVGSNVSLYQLYKTIADAAQVSAEAGQLKGQQAAEQMLARVDTPSGAAPAKSSETDNFLKGLLGTK